MKLALSLILLLPGLALATQAPKGKSLCGSGGCIDLEEAPLGAEVYSRPKPKIQPQEPLAPSEGKAENRQRSGTLPKERPIHTSKAQAVRESGNLPDYYEGDRSGLRAIESAVFNSQKSGPKLKGIHAGDILKAALPQEIVASSTVPTPVQAILLSGRHQGSVLLGEATLDRELKRVLISFSRLRLKNSDESYSVKASALSPAGSIGLVGEYQTETGKFFLAEMAAATAAGVLDATTQRSQTLNGNFVTEPTLANAGKQGAVAALSKTTERLAERARNAPEYTKLTGHQEIRIIFQDDPVSQE